MLSSRVMVMALDALESPEACDEACELVTVSLEAFTDPGAVEVRILGQRFPYSSCLFIAPLKNTVYRSGIGK